MRTRKPISSISYNSEEFLKMKLQELLKSHKISDFMYIEHEPEEDECAGKKHIHLYIEPNGQIDTMVLQDFFREFDPKKTDKPLGCINFRNSNSDDWLLYCQHFAPYLASKFQMREFLYEKRDFRFADEMNFEDLYFHAFHSSEWSKRNQILQALADNQNNPVNLINCGVVPLQQASQLNAYKYLQKTYGTFDRNGRENHDKQYFEYYQGDLDISIDKLNSSDIVELSDKCDFDDIIYRINR